MARGYPTPHPPPAEELPVLVEVGICVICKRRQAEEGSDKCGRCPEILRGP